MSFEEVKFNSQDNNKCSICLENFDTQEFIAKTSCNHLFHKICLQNWYNKHNTCPICRFSSKYQHNVTL